MRTIDADLFKSNVKAWAENIRDIRSDNKCFFTEENILKAIDDQPTVGDVRPVGEWIENYHESYIPIKYDKNNDLVIHKYLTYKCNICGRTEKNKEPYCNCGARMKDR